MERLEKSCCVVTVSEAASGHRSASCSGLIFNHRTGMLICSGVLFSGFIGATALHSRCLSPDKITQKLDIRVSFPAQAGLRAGQCAQGAATASGLSSAPQNQAAAELRMLVNCLEFRRASQRIFQESDEWRFQGNEEDEGLLRDSRLLSWFAVLQTGFEFVDVCTESIPCAQSASIYKGGSVVACGTPFGSLCTDLFSNTLSRGIVSNLAGEDNDVILTDARCLPGTEGGGLFLIEGSRVYLAGVIVSPLCWKGAEWIGLTLVCSVESIIRNILCCVKTEDPQRDICLHRGSPRLHPINNALATEKYPTVCLVDSGPFWGSGVVVSSRLVLTCRHVVGGKRSVTVRFYLKDRFHDVVGNVLFSTQTSSSYDLAVVQLRDLAPELVVPRLANSFQLGEDVVVLGYGALGRRCGPSLTNGILSKAITWKQQPVMLQTTCAVQAGASGGAVLRKHSGEVLGIVSSNTKDLAAKITYPHLNFSVPATVFHPLLQRFKHTQDVKVFRVLDTTEEEVGKIWRLQGAQSKL